MKTQDQHVLVRSERFDSLLVEYVRLSNSFFGQPPSVQKDLIESSFARWMAEFFIGYRRPTEAIAALSISHSYDNRMAVSAFRDETLAALPDLPGAAVQCFCLAHEIGHVLFPGNNDVSLETAVDGLPLSRHVERDLLAVGST